MAGAFTTKAPATYTVSYMTTLYILLAAVVLVFVFGVFAYNGFVTRVNRAKEALSDIDVQTKRRYDLIPNLISTVKGYATHESTVFENVTKARTTAMGATGMADKTMAEDTLSGMLKSLFAVAEAYPDLKANQNFLELQRELADTENKIQAARRFYNGTVRDLNTAVESFPSNLVASVFHFSKMDLFELADAAQGEPVKVQF